MMITKFYVLRSASYPIENFLNLCDGLDSSRNNISKIKELFKDDLFVYGILLASPLTYQTLQKWLYSDKGLDPKKERKLIKTLVGYYSRMCYRTSPYGVFSNFSFGEISHNKTNVDLNDSRIIFHKRPSMSSMPLDDYLLSDLNRIKEDNPKVIINNTLYAIGEKKRFIKKNNKRIPFSFSYESFEDTKSLNIILKIVEEKENILSICDELYDIFEDKSAVDNMLLALITENIIELEEKFSVVTHNPKAHCVSLSNLLISRNSNFEQLFVSDKREKHVEILSSTEHQTGDLLQLDMEKELSNKNLNKGIIDELLEDFDFLGKIYGPAQNYELEKFKKDYINRYEDREISLMHALDPEVGIGYGFQSSDNIIEETLLNNIYFPDNDTNGFRSSYNTKQYKLNQTILEQKGISYKITDKDLLNLKSENFKVEDTSGFIIGNIVSDTKDLFDNGKFLFIPSIALPQPYPLKLVSRFLYHKSDMINNFKEMFSENSENSVFAEIVVSMGGRIDNILIRPQFYNYEIPICSTPSDNVEKIALADLYVRIKSNKVILWSKKLNKEIKPILSSAHNFRIEGIPVLRFLCDIQYQNVGKGFEWDWGTFKKRSFLPRVVYKNIVLSRARWYLEKDLSIKTLQDFKLRLKNLKVKKYCCSMDGEKSQLFDTENEYFLGLLFELNQKADLTLYELIGPPLERNLIESNEGNFYSEILIPYKKKSATLSSNGIQKIIDNRSLSAPRYFLPFDSWGYLKIYANRIYLDKLISKLSKLIGITQKEEKIDSWFFIRYEDPDSHLRLRVKSSHSTTQIIHSIIDSLKTEMELGYIWKISIDTYIREIERYGFQNIDLIEQIYHYNSIAISKALVGLLEINESSRWQLALISLQNILNAFELNNIEKEKIINNLIDGFFQEAIGNLGSDHGKLLRVNIDQKYRAMKNEIDWTMDNRHQYWKFAKDIFEEERKQVAPIITQLSAKNSRERILELIMSICHMSLNRILISQARKQELIIYTFFKKQLISSLKVKC